MTSPSPPQATDAIPISTIVASMFTYEPFRRAAGQVINDRSIFMGEAK